MSRLASETFGLVSAQSEPPCAPDASVSAASVPFDSERCVSDVGVCPCVRVHAQEIIAFSLHAPLICCANSGHGRAE